MPTILEACECAEGDSVEDLHLLAIHRHFVGCMTYTAMGEDVNDAFSGLVRSHLLNNKRVVDCVADYLADSDNPRKMHPGISWKFLEL